MSRSAERHDFPLLDGNVWVRQKDDPYQFGDETPPQAWLAVIAEGLVCSMGNGPRAAVLELAAHLEVMAAGLRSAAPDVPE